MNTPTTDSDSPENAIAEKLQRAKLETEFNEKMRNLPNPISQDEE